jgi:ferredoxin
MCLTLPQTLITVMGIEKLVPTWTDLEVFLQLLPRSSTGERMNPYTSMWTGVTPGDGPQEFHLVLLDNGRTATLGDPAAATRCNCIRCSACLNVCPVYERTGGHAYGSVYPGPIGAVLSPQLTGIEDNASLPYASSLCGACYDVCPVMIDIPAMLVHLRAQHVEAADAAHRLPDARSDGDARRRLVDGLARGAGGRRSAPPGSAGCSGAGVGRISALPPPLSAGRRAATCRCRRRRRSASRGRGPTHAPRVRERTTAATRHARSTPCWRGTARAIGIGTASRRLARLTGRAGSPLPGTPARRPVRGPAGRLRATVRRTERVGVADTIAAVPRSAVPRRTDRRTGRVGARLVSGAGGGRRRRRRAHRAGLDELTRS